MIHNTDEKQYYLAGFVNLFNVVPTFVYPVFVRNGQYFLEDGETDTIQSFRKFDIQPHIIHSFYPLSAKKYSAYKVGSWTVYAFMTDEHSDIKFGDIYYIRDFLTDYCTLVKDEYVLDEIDIFLKETKAIVERNSKRLPVVIKTIDSDISPMSFGTLHKSPVLCRKTRAEVENVLLKPQRFDLPKSGAILLSDCRINPKEQSRSRIIKRECNDLFRQNDLLFSTFRQLSNAYAMEIVYDEDSIKEFVKRMILKKRWLISPRQRSYIYLHYVSGFPRCNTDVIMQMNMERAKRQLESENKGLKKLISFLEDVLEDRGKYNVQKMQKDD